MTNTIETTKTNPGLVPYDYGQMAGAGFEGGSKEDLALPFIAVLQSKSPEVESGNPKRIKGAEAGMLMNTSTKEMFPSLSFIPVFTRKAVVEWAPREQGGGFRGMHEIDAQVVVEARARFEADTNAKKRLSKDLLTKTGNNLIETVYVFGIALEADGETPAFGCVLPFTSTKIAVYKKQLYTPLYSLKGVPLFANRLRITTILENRPAGSSYNYRIEPLRGSFRDSLILPDTDLFKVAHQAYLDAHAGVSKIAEPAPRETVDAEASATDEVFS